MKGLLPILLFISFACKAQKIQIIKNTAPAPPNVIKLTLTPSNAPAGVGQLKISINGQAYIVSTDSLNFTFNLPVSANTSAALYKVVGSDSFLVRTLWSGNYYTSGSYAVKWDGTDNDSVPLPVADYVFKLRYNNISYTWKSVIGNTSDSSTGSTVIHAFEFINALTVSGTNAYCALGYAEASPSKFVFNTSNPHSKSYIVNNPVGGSDKSVFVANDGTNVYWAVNDPYSTSGAAWFVYATKISDNSPVTYSSSVTYTIVNGARSFPAIDTVNINANRAITGLTVSGSYIFVAHGGINQIRVYNKSTGALAQTIASITNPTAISADSSNNIWITSGTSLTKYGINSNGTITASIASITGLIQPQSVNVSTDGTYLVVCDAGASQQVKAFNNTTGASIWTLGQSGGYQSNATVAVDKFYFGDLRGNYPCSIAFQSDGSFWVVDYGNSRVQHFDAGRNYINNLQYMPSAYSSSVDPNSPTRIFSDYKEFSYNYSTGSWSFVNNWGANVPTSYDDRFARISDVATLSNGRTYATILNSSTLTKQVVELVANGAMRLTGITYLYQYYVSAGLPVIVNFQPDGSLVNSPYVASTNLGQSQNWTRRLLTGFDGSNNPLWGSSSVIATTANPTALEPYYTGNSSTVCPGEISSSNILISFDGGSHTNNQYHLGGIRLGSNKFLWQASRATWNNNSPLSDNLIYKQYSGNFPTDGSFDIGNQSNNMGTMCRVVGHVISYGYHGEFWKQGQTNMYNFFWDDGLYLGQCGTTQDRLPANAEAAAMFAGNAYNNRMVQVGGKLYIIHPDESMHSGVHVWEIANLQSVGEVTVPITIVYPKVSERPALAGVDLMAGLPITGTLTDGTAGWHKSPNTELLGNSDNWWYARTNLKTFNKIKSPDLYIRYQKIIAGDYTINRDLGTNTGLGSWHLWGQLWEEGAPNLEGTKMFLEVLDNSGKTIVQFHFQQEFSNFVVYANSTQIASAPISTMSTVINQFQNLDIRLVSGQIQVTYANYTPVLVSLFDNTATIGNPTTFQIRHNYLGGNDYEKKTILDGWRFNNQ